MKASNNLEKVDAIMNNVCVDSFKFNKQTDRDFSWSVNVIVPLFDGFSSYAAIDEQKKKLEELNTDIEFYKNKIHLDVSNSLHKINLSKIRYLNATIQTDYMKEKIRNTRMKHNVKQKTKSEVELAKNDVWKAEVEEKITSIDMLQSLAEYYIILGKSPIKDQP